MKVGGLYSVFVSFSGTALGLVERVSIYGVVGTVRVAQIPGWIVSMGGHLELGIDWRCWARFRTYHS